MSKELARDNLLGNMLFGVVGGFMTGTVIFAGATYSSKIDLSDLYECQAFEMQNPQLVGQSIPVGQLGGEILKACEIRGISEGNVVGSMGTSINYDSATVRLPDSNSLNARIAFGEALENLPPLGSILGLGVGVYLTRKESEDQ